MEDTNKDAKEVEESSASTDANTEESSTSENQAQEEQAQDSSEETSSQDDRLDKHPRFQELIKSNKEYKAQLSEMSGKLEQFERQMQSRSSDKETKAEQKRDFVKELTDEGVKPEIAKKIAEMAAEMAKEKLKPFEQNFENIGRSATLSQWMAENKVIPNSETDLAMSAYFNKLNADDQAWIKENGKRGLDYLKAMSAKSAPYQPDKSSGQQIGKGGAKDRAVKDAEYYRTLKDEDWNKMGEKEYEQAVKIMKVRE